MVTGLILQSQGHNQSQFVAFLDFVSGSFEFFFPPQKSSNFDSRQRFLISPDDWRISRAVAQFAGESKRWTEQRQGSTVAAVVTGRGRV